MRVSRDSQREETLEIMKQMEDKELIIQNLNLDKQIDEALKQSYRENA